LGRLLVRAIDQDLGDVTVEYDGRPVLVDSPAFEHRSGL
jgi:hypothetical protein